jgi:hypothetical protein
MNSHFNLLYRKWMLPPQFRARGLAHGPLLPLLNPVKGETDVFSSICAHSSIYPSLSLSKSCSTNRVFPQRRDLTPAILNPTPAHLDRPSTIHRTAVWGREGRCNGGTEALVFTIRSTTSPVLNPDASFDRRLLLFH